MKLRDIIPPVISRWATKSLAQTFLNAGTANASGGTSRLLYPYEQSAWVMRAIQLKTGEISNAPVEFYASEVEYDDTAFAAWWKEPFLGPGQRKLSLAEGRTQLAAWTDLEGEFFILLDDQWLLPVRKGTSLPPLIIARPDRMSHIIQAGKIIGWRYSDASGRSYNLVPEQVVHRPLFNPYNDFRGLAPVTAVYNAAETDYLAGLYVRNLMRNNGDQGVYVIAKDGIPDDKQRDQIVAELRDKRRRALRGEFVATFLGGNIAIEDAKAQAPNADLNATRLQSRHEIFIGLGVPASMADIKASYSIGSSSDRYQLITGTCQSLAKIVDEVLGHIATAQTGKSLTARADWDDHPVMQEVRAERLKSADSLWSKGMPMQAINDYLGLGMKPFKGWQIGYLPFSVAPISEGATDPAGDPALGEPADPADNALDVGEVDPAVENLRLVLLARQRAARPVCRTIEPGEAALRLFTCSCHLNAPADLIERAERPAHEIAQWKKSVSDRLPILRAYRSRINRALMEARAETLAKIHAHYHPQKSAVIKAAAADLVFDGSKFKTSLFAGLRKQAKTSLDAASAQLYAEVGRDDAFKFPPEAVLEYTRARENLLAGVPDEIHAKIKEELEEGIVAGETTEQLATRIRGAFNELTQGRAVTVAATEVSAVYGAGRDEAMVKAGVPAKGWLTSGNDNVRATHAAANGQVVPVDEPFEVGGEELQFPGDSAGSAENVINCHCVSVARALPSEN